MMRFIYSFIIIVHCTTSLQCMDYGTCESANETDITNNSELSRVAELVKNARRFTPIIKEIHGLVSAIHQMDDQTIRIVESDSPEAVFSTLHVLNMQKNSWNARPINADERTLAEFGFNIESMDKEHQTKTINLLKSAKVWDSIVQPVSMDNGNMVFADTDNTIVTIDPKEPKMVSSFTLPPTIPLFKEIRLFSAPHVILSTNTIDSGTVHLFSPDGTHLFYEPTDDTTEKPQSVIAGNNNTIAVGRSTETRVYAYDPNATHAAHTIQPAPFRRSEGSLISWYDNRLLTLEKSIPCASSSPWALPVGNGFFCTESKDDPLIIYSPHMGYIQKIKGHSYKALASHSYGEHSSVCRCPFDNKVPLLHGVINKIVLSRTGRMMFDVKDGLFAFLKSEPLKLEGNPQTLEEFHFLAQDDKAECVLFKKLAHSASYGFSWEELPRYFRIPERFRKKIEETRCITSPCSFHTLTNVTKEERDFFAKAGGSRDGYIIFDRLCTTKFSVSSNCFVDENQLKYYFCIPERLRTKMLKTVVLSSPCNIHCIGELTQQERDFIEQHPHYGDSPYGCFIQALRAKGYYQYYREKSDYQRVPERFRKVIEDYYNQQPQDGTCVVL